MNKKLKLPNEVKLHEAELKLIENLNWLQNTGRLTKEERDNLAIFIHDVQKETKFYYLGLKK